MVNLYITNRKIPIISGSAGRDKPMPSTTSSMFMESGTKNTNMIMSKSNFNNASRNNIAKAGKTGVQ